MKHLYLSVYSISVCSMNYGHITHVFQNVVDYLGTFHKPFYEYYEI